MPPRTKITKSAIREAALTVVREHGAAACNARAVAAKLSCSTQPIFSHYRSMEEVRHDVIVRAYELYRAYLAREMSSGNYPPYKASGIAYIRFAKEERELFKLLFMRDRSGEKISSTMEDVDDIIELLCRSTGMSEETARTFHLEMWIYVHGIATMCATSFLDLDLPSISDFLTDAYLGLRARHCGEEQPK